MGDMIREDRHSTVKRRERKEIKQEKASDDENKQ